MAARSVDRMRTATVDRSSPQRPTGTAALRTRMSGWCVGGGGGEQVQSLPLPDSVLVFYDYGLCIAQILFAF